MTDFRLTITAVPGVKVEHTEDAEAPSGSMPRAASCNIWKSRGSVWRRARPASQSFRRPRRRRRHPASKFAARRSFPSAVLLFPDPGGPAPGMATTIGVVATNAKLTKGEGDLGGRHAHGGLVRTIYPVHTMFDGDAIFALATGEVEADVNWVGTVAADVMAEAVVWSVKAARVADGCQSSVKMSP